MLGYDFMFLQMEQFIQDNIINTVTRGFALRDSLLHGVRVDDLAKGATVSLPLSRGVSIKVMKAALGKACLVHIKCPVRFLFME